MICASIGAFIFTVILLFLAAIFGKSGVEALAGGTKALFWSYVVVTAIWLFVFFPLEVKINKIIAKEKKAPPPPYGAALAGGFTARACAIIGAYLLMVVTTAAANFGGWDMSVLASGFIFLVVSCVIASGTKVLDGE